MACGHMRKVSRRTVLCGLGVSLLSLARRTRSVDGPVPILDTHVHFPRSPRDEIYDLDAAVVLREMDRFGIEEVILSPPPFPPGRRPPSVDELRAVTRKQPRIAFAAGGEPDSKNLASMIVTPEAELQRSPVSLRILDLEHGTA